MKAIVKAFVVGTLGLAVLFASPALSLAAFQKPDQVDPSKCRQTSPDRWDCLVDGKEYTCVNPYDPKTCTLIPKPWGTAPARPRAPVVKPKTPGGDILMK